MPEASFQKRLVTFLRKRNAIVFNFVGNMYQKGIPDLYVCHTYWSGWLELKYADGERRGLQIVNIRELRRRGQNAYFFTEKEGVYTLENHDNTWGIRFRSIEEWWTWICDQGEDDD